MNVVRASAVDHPAIVEVWEASVRATHRFLSEEDIQFFKPLVRDEFLAAVELYCVKGAGGRVLGFLGVAEGKIEMLFLDPASRGKGLGRLLVRFALDELGADQVDVNEQNPSALGFYEYMGFRVVNRSPVDGMGKPFPILHMVAG